MESINGVIDATNAIIESMSAILSPPPPENRGTTYDKILGEFSNILKVKSEIIYEKNEIINDLRGQLIKVESLSVSRIEQLENGSFKREK